jgi:hypothetical protein
MSRLAGKLATAAKITVGFGALRQVANEIRPIRLLERLIGATLVGLRRQFLPSFVPIQMPLFSTLYPVAHGSFGASAAISRNCPSLMT